MTAAHVVRWAIRPQPEAHLKLLFLALFVALLMLASVSKRHHETASPFTSPTSASSAPTTPSPTPTPTPILAYSLYAPYVFEQPPALELPKPQTASVSAASGAPAREVDGVPAYVPIEWRERWLACLVRPDRHTLSETAWAGSREAGVVDGWDYADAMSIAAAEGGNDVCQFNTQGSGACGYWQLLYCPPDGLTPEGQLRGALAKYRDGGNSFDRHWRNHWQK